VPVQLASNGSMVLSVITSLWEFVVSSFLPIAALFISILSAWFTYLPWNRRRRNLLEKLKVFKENLSWSITGARSRMQGLERQHPNEKLVVNFFTVSGLYDAYGILDDDLPELASLGEFQHDRINHSFIHLRIRLKEWYERMKTESKNGWLKLEFKDRDEYEEWRDGLNELKELEYTLQIINIAIRRLEFPLYRHWSIKSQIDIIK